MAIPPSNIPFREWQSKAVYAVCDKHGIDTARYQSVDWHVDPMTGTKYGLFRFKATVIPRNLALSISALVMLTENEFTGPVIEAAVPELFAKLQALYETERECTRPVQVQYTVDELNKLMEKH